MTDPNAEPETPPEPATGVVRTGQVAGDAVHHRPVGIPTTSGFGEYPDILLQGARDAQHSELTWKLISKYASVAEDEKDRLFRSVTIPMQFFKIIAWVDDSGKLKATGFKLSQETLVDHIKFDEMMRMEEEALDIDKVAAFKNYQLSIKKLTKLTGIDFSTLEKYDTYKPGTNGDETLLTDEESLML